MIRRVDAARATGALGATAALAGTAAAHSGTTHAGTPHWLLVALVALGGVAAAGVVAAYRRRLLSGTQAAVGALAASVVGGFGLIGVVELQVVAETTPGLTDIYPPLSLAVASLMALGSVVVGRTRYPERPRYTALGVLLAAWVVYPVAMPNGGVYHPLGHTLVVAVVLAVAYVLRRDAWAVVQSLRADRGPRLAGLGAGVVFVAVFSISAGTLTFNPDTGVGAPTEALVMVLPVADPLVAWPAVEFVFPSVPMGGFVSVGTVLLFGLLGSLVALNVGVVAQQYRAGRNADSSTSALGMAATTGATACCCCAPAFYGLLSVFVGGAATPAYWAFMNPSSPLGGSFFAASVLLMVSGLLRATGGSADGAAAVSS
ncbi:hypothetical protein [Halobacterium jilantaiense]|uniref:Uncharacterized protein n=1 Tax=Halobacterium jilantaiense TaxID=355548 RepID=A0A1I0N5P3_9EURY|nr:hypothetical protein [Halobacterium jilantaiense]SEV96402.1 hypothetical protein SAMN04487945_0624 [Halobacterium jilantaiense]